MSEIHVDNDFDEIISIELENDELVRLVTSNADVASQYVVFQNSNDEYFAINVAKVEELIEYKILDVTKTTDSSGVMKGTAKIREHFVNIVCFDSWLGINSRDNSIYELVILCDYAGVRLAIIVKSVYGVLNIEPSEMFDDSDKDTRISYLCEIVVNNKKILCKVFDSDQFLADVMPSKFAKELQKSEMISSNDKNVINKEILIAEDSVLIQNAVKQLMEKMQLSYQVFNNGKELLDSLKNENIDNIGLIITDLEMPVMGGLELLKECLNHDYYRKIPIVVNTNMANASIINTAEKLGARKVIKKLDLLTLREVILEYADR
ncbi:response regulator [Candidatus Sulfurimonas marisnigri]|uniref:Response regulator n=1 Tax=Candidatus Sulfurimonas marisnigri TaxID=2740405 RepID=A0A7S7M1P0_9BACT|nr:response regulator [Candidatus Sulfurimonas marisnigri]QOY55295.1 response regulator [Candidatus Sulfurimonas marisnigri]